MSTSLCRSLPVDATLVGDASRQPVVAGSRFGRKFLAHLKQLRQGD